MPAIEVRSEIGPLKRVLLHRPGGELENLMPEYIERLLFDDIPYLKIAREEHDAFCEVLSPSSMKRCAGNFSGSISPRRVSRGKSASPA
mgnify:CR=1 FL=1